MAAAFPNKAPIRWAWLGSTVAPWAKSPTVNMASLPLTPVAKATPFWTGVSISPRRGLTKPTRRYGVPADLTFQTEPQLALEMLDGLVERAEVPFLWVVADEHYGMIPSFFDGVEARQKWYFAEVPTATQVWVGAPQVETPGPGALGRPRKHPRLATGEAKAK